MAERGQACAGIGADVPAIDPATGRRGACAARHSDPARVQAGDRRGRRLAVTIDVEKEKDALLAEIKNEGKPEQAWPKIVEGKLNGFFKTVTLLEQPFVKDNKQTIDALVKTLGPNAGVRRFARVKIGEE